MLSFKKGNYTLEELQIMETALAYCVYNMKCYTDDCANCKYRRVCGVFSRCHKYVHDLIQEKIEKTS